MPIKLNGSTSGYSQMQAAAVAGNNTLTLPTTTGNLLADNGSGALTIQTVNSGTSNALTLQSNNTTALTIDTSQNVGIGTSSPAGNSITNYRASGYTEVRTASGANSTSIGQDASAGYIGTNTNLPLISITNGTERMRIDSSGNVGIGTASPSFKLDVQGTIAGNFVQQLYNSSTGAGAQTLYLAKSSGGSGVQFGQTQSSLAGFVNVLDSAPLIFLTSGTERARIDSSGNVAIGVSSTTRKLDVYTSASSSSNNTIRVWGYQAAFEVLNQGSTQNWYFGVQDASSNKLYIGRGSNAAQGISPSIAIDTSDNVLVGTTSVINGSNAILQVLNVNGGRPGVNVGNSVGSSATNCIIFTNSNGTVGSIVTSGSATGYNTSSDYRLKENITLMTAGLEKISALKPVIYDWISDKTKGEGFIAHELQAVIPLAVTGEKDAVNEDGSIKPQGVDYSKIVVHLVAAIKELSAEVEALKAKVGA